MRATGRQFKVFTFAIVVYLFSIIVITAVDAAGFALCSAAVVIFNSTESRARSRVIIPVVTVAIGENAVKRSYLVVLGEQRERRRRHGNTSDIGSGYQNRCEEIVRLRLRTRVLEL